MRGAERSNAPVSRISFIDFLRMIAALAVVYQHVVERSDLTFLYPSLQLAPGVFGVALFFFISGYVIPYSVRKWSGVDAFAIRRFFRIAPAYYLTLALILALSLLVPAMWPHVVAATFKDWALNLTLAQDLVRSPTLLGVAWTLVIEVVWYGLFVLHFLFFRGRRVFETSLLFSAAIVALSVVSIVIGQRLPFGRIGLIHAAFAGYCAYKYHKGDITLRSFLWVAAAFVVSMTISQIVSFGYFTHPTTSLFNGASGWGTAAIVFFSYSLSRSLREAPVSNWRPFTKLGEISYSIYLVHGVLLVVHLFYFGDKLVWLSVPLATLVLSWAMFSWIERPGIELGRALTQRYTSRFRGSLEGSRSAPGE